MAHTRLVWGILHRADGTPIPECEVRIDVPRTTTTTHAQLPGTRYPGPLSSANVANVVTDADGRWETALEVDVPFTIAYPGANVTIGTTTQYSAGTPIPFVVPDGDSPISIMTILASMVPDPLDPTLPNMVAHIESDLLTHEGRTDNPHAVTADQVDAYTTTEVNVLLGHKADDTALTAHVEDTGNPHAVTKAQVGLGAVPNVDATDRANHTGTQAASTISDFAAAADARITAQRNTAGGVAGLDETGHVPMGVLNDDVARVHPTVEEQIAFAVVDEDGRRTWIESDMEGRPTQRAGELITEAVAPTITEAVEANVGVEDQDSDITGLSFAVVDEDGRRTWLEADQAGRPTARALALIGAGAVPGDMQFVSGPDIVCWGDSMTAAGWPQTMADAIGRTVKNGGVGGEAALSILARQGGEPYRMVPQGGEVPASGPVDVTLYRPPGWPGLQGSKSWSGTLSGVHGTLSLIRDPNATQYVHSDLDRYVFTRDAAGDAVTVDRPSPFFMDFAETAREDIAIFWIGRNDAYSATADYVVGAVERAIQYLTPLDKRYLVMGVSIGAGETVGTAKRDNIEYMNRRLRDRFGVRYIDVPGYLVEYGLQDAGFTPTPQDTSDIANGIVPDSLRSDGVHLNSAGNQIIASIVAKRLRELEWI